MARAIQTVRHSGKPATAVVVKAAAPGKKRGPKGGRDKYAIPVATAKRIFRAWGVERATKGAVAVMSEAARVIMTPVVNDMVSVSRSYARKTVNAEDFNRASAANGVAIH